MSVLGRDTVVQWVPFQCMSNGRWTDPLALDEAPTAQAAAETAVIDCRPSLSAPRGTGTGWVSHFVLFQ